MENLITDNLMTAATVCLMLFSLVAGFDGIYFHLYKYKLYARQDSFYEHKMHTISAVLFIPVVYFLFGANFSGLLLWLGVLFILAESYIEIADVLSEKDSRASLGGLSSGEYATHVVAITLRAAAIALALAAKPLSAWDLSAPLVANQQYSPVVLSTALNMMIGNVAMVLLHVWLMRKKYRAEPKAYSQACCGIA